MSETLYLKIEKNNEITNTKVTIGDVAKMWCTNTTVTNRVKTLKLMTVPSDRSGRYSVSVVKVIELINKELPNVEVQNIGEADFLLDYKKNKLPEPWFQIVNAIKVFLVCVIIFLGSAYAIMAYNNDVGTLEIFQLVYSKFLGIEDGASAGHILEIMYSVGLTVGIIVFYNHFAGKRITSDPTPIEVEMNTYESDIDDALIQRGSRSGKEDEVQ